MASVTAEAQERGVPLNDRESRMFTVKQLAAWPNGVPDWLVALHSKARIVATKVLGGGEPNLYKSEKLSE